MIEQEEWKVRAEQIEDLAYNKVPAPPDLVGADLMLYMAFGALYGFAAHATMPINGKAYKQIILEQYEKWRIGEGCYQKAQIACLGINTLVRELKRIPDIQQRPILMDFIKTMEGE